VLAECITAGEIDVKNETKICDRKWIEGILLLLLVTSEGATTGLPLLVLESLLHQSHLLPHSNLSSVLV